MICLLAFVSADGAALDLKFYIYIPTFNEVIERTVDKDWFFVLMKMWLNFFFQQTGHVYSWK